MFFFKRRKRETFGQNFKRFFFRGLAILLPTILTVWLLLAAYNFLDRTIARPINVGIREIILTVSSYPTVTDAEIEQFKGQLQLTDPREYNRWKNNDEPAAQMRRWARRDKLEHIWDDAVVPLDLVGVTLAVVLIYLVGGLVGSFVGRRAYLRGERLVQRVPLISSVYSSIKQVTDFLVGERPKNMQFSRVVAVQYPRKGLWSIGLVTGDTMQTIETNAGKPCLTVFIPSSPTPFTGYVITVPRDDTFDLPISVDDALRFTISGGVVVPPHEVIKHVGSRRRDSKSQLAATGDAAVTPAAPPAADPRSEVNGNPDSEADSDSEAENKPDAPASSPAKND